MEIGLIGVIKNTKEALSIPLRGHGQERCSASQEPIGGDKGNQRLLDSSVVHTTFPFGGSHNGCSAVNFSAELKNVEYILFGGSRGVPVVGVHDTFSCQ
eukprot:14643314-Heterocapsa_arctica.AAC.1